METIPGRKPKQAVYRNVSGGRFAAYDLTWEVGQERPVIKEMENDKKFKHAVKLGCLVKV